MKLTFVNVGYGEAILLECPDPTCREDTFVMLIDGGGAEDSEFADRSSGRIPLADYLAQRNLSHIDVMANTHVHEDHICGMLPAAQAFPPDLLWMIPSASFCSSEMRNLDVSLAQNDSQRKFMQAINTYQELCCLVTSRGGRVETPKAGMSGELCQGLRYQVLAPNAARIEELEARFRQVFSASAEDFLSTLDSLDCRMNNFSLILMLDYRGTRILLPGDTNRNGYADLDPAEIKADLFKVGHHGQIDGADQALIDKVQPQAVVCCASSDCRYNSAHPDLLRMLADSGAKLYFSDCPPALDETIPPHQALTFTLGEQGAVSAEYL